MSAASADRPYIMRLARRISFVKGEPLRRDQAFKVGQFNADRHQHRVTCRAALTDARATLSRRG
jgi:hypothetical protein